MWGWATFETSEETNTVEKNGKKVSESKSGAVRYKARTVTFCMSRTFQNYAKILPESDNLLKHGREAKNVFFKYSYL